MSLPYEIVGTPRTRALTAQSFEPGQQVLGLMSTVAKMEVPRNIAMVLRKGAPLQAYIKAIYETQGALTISGGNVVVDLGARASGWCKANGKTPAFPPSSTWTSRVSYRMTTVRPGQRPTWSRSTGRPGW